LLAFEYRQCPECVGTKRAHWQKRTPGGDWKWSDTPMPSVHLTADLERVIRAEVARLDAAIPAALTGVVRLKLRERWKALIWVLQTSVAELDE
jgi:hypothetical protein